MPMIGKKLEAPITLELYYHNQKNMLVERTFSVVENLTGDRGVCTSCPINIVCFKFVDRQTCDVHTQDVEYYSSRSGDYLSSNFVRRLFIPKPNTAQNLVLRREHTPLSLHKYFPYHVPDVKEILYLCTRKRIKENKEE